jgi:hypothetical protein
MKGMRTMRNTLALAVFGLMAAACGDSEGVTPEVAKFQRLTQAAGDSLTEHCGDDAMASACTTERDRYDKHMRPSLDGMSELSGEMDECMRDMGHASSANMRETCDAMLGELDDHVQGVCSDSEARRAKTESHCETMRGLIDHARSRANDMHDMMDGMGMMGGCHPMHGDIRTAAIPKE